MSADEKVAAIASEWLGKPVSKVEAEGSDWAGDSGSGFYEEFTVTLVGTDENGKRFWEKVEGTELKSLWDFVMAKAVSA